MHLDDVVEGFLGLKPRSCARLALKLRGQPSTIFMIVASGSRLMRATTLSPATRRSASICSAMVQARPGNVTVRRLPSFAVSIVPA